MSLRPDPSNPGLNYTFSEPIRQSLALAGDVARTDDGVVEPKHLLLGMLLVNEATALSVLDCLKVDRNEISDRVGQSLGRGNPDDIEREEVRYTKEAKQSLEFALAEARILDSIYVGTEHLLLGFLRQEGTIARQVLNAFGVELEEARRETQNVWESGEDEAGTGRNVADEAMMIKVLRRALEDGDETVAEFVRRLDAADTADWARFPDGSWKTWEEVDWDTNGDTIWRLVLERQERREQAALLLGEAGLVDPQVLELEERLRTLEEEGKSDTLEYAKVQFARDLLQAPLRERGDDDDEGEAATTR